MPFLSVGATRVRRWWTVCLVGIVLLLRDACAQNPNNDSSPCSHFHSVCHIEFRAKMPQTTSIFDDIPR